MQDRVRIFDTTLRDGEQAPGCTMHAREKLAVATQLALLNVDVIEAGFPAASLGEVESVTAIAKEVGTDDGPVICGLARAGKRDIDTCFSAVSHAKRHRIHTFIATSDIHMEHKLGMSRSQVKEKAAEMVAYARTLCDDVEFSPEDAGRSDPKFLCEVLAVAVQAGATTLNIPDTVGYCTPAEYGPLIERICAMFPDVTVSTHCHDDLGLAVANSLAGVRAGARQVECTINGIGERAGNACLEEVAMALNTRTQYFGVTTGINTRELVPTSRLVSECTGVVMPANKAIVGANAFAHEAGIHQDGIIKNRLTYEIMTAESVGFDSNSLVLGKHSGRRALRKHVEEDLGYAVSEGELDTLFEKFKAIADVKKVVARSDMLALLKEINAREASA